MNRGLRLAFLAWVWPLAGVGPGQSPAEDAELRSHLQALARRVDDVALDLTVRERVALEMAGTLDRAALAAPTPEARRQLWAEAAGVLDEFTARHPAHSQARAFRVQAGVYAWAGARTYLEAVRADPADREAGASAVSALAAVVGRLKGVVEGLGDATDVVAQNARYRYAQALADLADAGPRDDEAATRRVRESEALRALAAPITEPSLAGYARLLRATLLARLGRYDEALKEVEAAASAKPAPAESEVVDARLDVLTGLGKFAEAARAVATSRLDAGSKPGLRARVWRAAVAATAPGPARDAAEGSLFEDLKAMRDAGRPETRSALAAAAATLTEPGPRQAPGAWDLLADGADAGGDPARAGALERQAADRADALGLAGPAANYRLKAGAYLFQASKFAEADPLLTRVAEDPKAGPTGARAGLLRALARGRALALRQPGATAAGYASALRDQLTRYPTDPSASEARWLLGRLRLAAGDRDGAMALWDAIPHGDPRWVDARVEAAAERQRGLDEQRLNNDREAAGKLFDRARAALDADLGRAAGDAESNALRLASARLELTGGVGHADQAQRVLQHILKSAARPDHRDAARRLNVVALAQTNRWVEAEQAARLEVKQGGPDDLLELVRLLDRAASEAESDLRARRNGLLLRVLLAGVLERSDALSPARAAETRLRQVRALLFSGDDGAARRALTGWTPAPGTPEPGLLRDLAETYLRLDAPALAVDAQRLRGRLVANGSPAWFDARYGLALAYYRAGKPKDALHLIDATAILHPGLGGGDLRDRFIRLRQRIGSEN